MSRKESSPSRTYIVVSDSKWKVLNVYENFDNPIETSVSKWAYNVKCFEMNRDDTDSNGTVFLSKALTFDLGEPSILTDAKLLSLSGKKIDAQLTGGGLNLEIMGDDGLVFSVDHNESSSKTNNKKSNNNNNVVVCKASRYLVEGTATKRKACTVYNNNSSIVEPSNEPFNPFTSAVNLQKKKDKRYVIVSYDVPLSVRRYDALDDDVGSQRSAFDAGSYGHDSWLKQSYVSKNDITDGLLTNLPLTIKQKKNFTKDVSTDPRHCQPSDLRTSELTLTVSSSYVFANATTIVAKNEYMDDVYGDNVFFLIKTKKTDVVDSISEDMSKKLFEWNLERSFNSTTEEKVAESDASFIAKPRSMVRSKSIQFAEMSAPPPPETSARTDDDDGVSSKNSDDHNEVGDTRVKLGDDDVVKMFDGGAPAVKKSKTKTFDEKDIVAACIIGRNVNRARTFKRLGSKLELTVGRIVIPVLPIFQTVLNVTKILEYSAVDVVEGKLTKRLSHELLILDVVPNVGFDDRDATDARTLCETMRENRNALAISKQNAKTVFETISTTRVVDQYGKSVKGRQQYRQMFNDRTTTSVFDPVDKVPNVVSGNNTLNDYSRSISVCSYGEADDKTIRTIVTKVVSHVEKELNNAKVGSVPSKEAETYDDVLNWDSESTILASTSDDDARAKGGRNAKKTISEKEHAATVSCVVVSKTPTLCVNGVPRDASFLDEFGFFKKSDGVGDGSHVLGYAIVCMANSVEIVERMRDPKEGGESSDGYKPIESFRSISDALRIDSKDSETVAFLKKRYAQYLMRHLLREQPNFFEYCRTVLSRAVHQRSDDRRGISADELSDYLNADENDVFERWLKPSDRGGKDGFNNYDAFLNNCVFRNAVILPVSTRFTSIVKLVDTDQFEIVMSELNGSGRSDAFESSNVAYECRKWTMRVNFLTRHETL